MSIWPDAGRPGNKEKTKRKRQHSQPAVELLLSESLDCHSLINRFGSLLEHVSHQFRLTTPVPTTASRSPSVFSCSQCQVLSFTSSGHVHTGQPTTGHSRYVKARYTWSGKGSLTELVCLWACLQWLVSPRPGMVRYGTPRDKHAWALQSGLLYYCECSTQCFTMVHMGSRLIAWLLIHQFMMPSNHVCAVFQWNDAWSACSHA